MYKIIDKKKKSGDLYAMKIIAPRVAKAIKPGQFVIIRINEKGERIPFSVCDFNREDETVTIIFKNEGSSLNELANLNVGDEILDFVGPLGKASILISKNTEELKDKNILFVSEDSGSTRIYPELKWLYDNEILAYALLGFKSREEVVFKKRIEAAAKDVFISTVDGSLGEKGNVCSVLKSMLKNRKFDMVIAMGSTEMMRDVSNITKEQNIDTIVSLSTLMLDGTGMCGACRLTVGGEVKFACQEGPEFDGHLVDFDEVMIRQQIFSYL